MAIGYKELMRSIKATQANIDEVQEQISLCENEYELGQLSAELDHYETQLMVTEDYIDRIVDRGRGD
jgi:hypothetical protein